MYNLGLAHSVFRKQLLIRHDGKSYSIIMVDSRNVCGLCLMELDFGDGFSNGQPLLLVHNICANYNAVHIFDKVNISIESAGDIVRQKM